VNLDVAVVHDQVLSQEVLDIGPIDNVKLRIALQAVDQIVNSLLILIPVLFVLLNFTLRTTQILIELLKIIMIVNLTELVLGSDLVEVTQDFFAVLARLLR
jgi:hypothetical protein